MLKSAWGMRFLGSPTLQKKAEVQGPKFAETLHPSAEDGATARCCTWCKARLRPRLQLW